MDWRFLSDILHELYGSPRHGNPRNPLDCLIYVMLSRKTPIPVAARLFGRLKRRYASWERVLTAKVETIRGLISEGGLADIRASDLRNVLADVKQKFGRVSLSRLRLWNNSRCLAFLTGLPGVGQKTALCVMMYTLDRRVFPADAHCIRVLTRLGLLEEGLEHRRAQDELLRIVPGAHAYRLHVNLIAHGQAYCTVRNPRCDVCPIRLFCASYRKRAQTEWISDRTSPTALDLFAGAGGTSLGLQQAGYRILAAVDEDQWATQTFRLNHPEVPSDRILTRDIKRPETLSELLRILNGEAPDLVIGGPPCQGFSMIGERIRARNGSQPFIDKPGNALYREFVSYVNRLQPKVVVMENVPALHSFRNGHYRQQIIHDLGEHFAVEALELDAHDFGVPQHRKRALFVAVNVKTFGDREKAQLLVRAIREDLQAHSKPGTTLKGTIGDLPRLGQDDGREVMRRWPRSGRNREYVQAMAGDRNSLIFNHVSRPLNVRDQLLYRLLRPGEKAADAVEKYAARHLMAYRTDIFHDKYRKLKMGEAAPTIMAHLSHDGHMYIHPERGQARSITVREAARMQSFPDDFIFYGPRTHQFRHVGNAVPPLLARDIGEVLKKHILNRQAS